jgi:hypothetical protein
MGMPNLQNLAEKMAFATVSASLFTTAVTIACFVKASVMQRMYLCCHPAASIGQKRSACLVALVLVKIAGGEAWELMVWAVGSEGRTLCA